MGPDNGIFTGIIRDLNDYRATCIDQERFALKGAHGTFHGRDLFAPVAGLLSLGELASDMGSQITDPVCLDLPEPVMKKSSIHGEVVHIDIFGNAITNIGGEEIAKLGPPENLTVEVKKGQVDIITHYAAAGDESPHALVNSDGYLEIFINQGDASSNLSLLPGTTVTVKPSR